MAPVNRFRLRPFSRERKSFAARLYGIAPEPESLVQFDSDRYAVAPVPKKAHSPESAPSEPDYINQLDRSVKELTAQIRTLSLIMDEIRDELIYAVRNDRFNAIPESTWRSTQHSPTPFPSTLPVPTAGPIAEKREPSAQPSRRSPSLFE